MSEINSIGRYSVAVRVPAEESLVVEDGVQNQSFFDLNVLFSPIGELTGKVEFFIGPDLGVSEDYVAESGATTFSPTPPNFPEIFPPTVGSSSFDSEGGVTGEEFKASVKITNDGDDPIVCKIHFMRKY